MPRIRAIHPAIQALRTEVAAFKVRQIRQGGSTGRLMDSDLKHDERAIAAHPDQSFLWIVSPFATYMARCGTPEDCRADTTRQWSNVPAVMLVRTVLECDPGGLSEHRIALYLWNRSALSLQENASKLLEGYADIVRSGAESCIRALIAPLRDDLAAYTSWGSTSAMARITREIATLESEIDRLAFWGPY